MNMLKRKTLISLFMLFIMMVTAGCSATDTTSSKDTSKLITDDSKPYIGFLLDTLQDERWYKDKALFEDEINKRSY
jgi:ABC-type xylose transport system substrate-binding protein